MLESSRNKAENPEIGTQRKPKISKYIMITLHYFASLRETLNTESEQLEWNTDLNKVALLKQYLSLRGQEWQCFSDNSSILSAVNQEIAKNISTINDGDEIAFFPPVTGG